MNRIDPEVCFFALLIAIALTIGTTVSVCTYIKAEKEKAFAEQGLVEQQLVGSSMTYWTLPNKDSP